MNARIALSLALAGLFAGRLALAGAPAGQYTIANGTVYDTKTKLTWQQAAPATLYAWADAKDYCSGLSLAGIGWRLPTVKELHTIVSDSLSIDATAFPGTATDTYTLWSSSPLAGSSSSVWYVGIGYAGVTGTSDVSDVRNVRCVR